MNLKEFFKPELNKIIITSIFTLFIISVSSIGSPPPLWFKVIEPLYIFLMFPLIISNLGLLSFIIGFPYWYFVSCIIVALYRVFRKWKK